MLQNLRGDGIAAYLGASGGGTAETTWIREKFVGPADAGLFLANYNVLNQWVWDSVFDHTMRGITNYIANRVNGAGGFAANLYPGSKAGSWRPVANCWSSCSRPMA